MQNEGSINNNQGLLSELIVDQPGLEDQLMLQSGELA